MTFWKPALSLFTDKQAPT